MGENGGRLGAVMDRTALWPWCLWAPEPTCVLSEKPLDPLYLFSCLLEIA